MAGRHNTLKGTVSGKSGTNGYDDNSSIAMMHQVGSTAAASIMHGTALDSDLQAYYNISKDLTRECSHST